MFTRIRKLNSLIGDTFVSKYKTPSKILSYGPEGLTWAVFLAWLFPGFFVAIAPRAHEIYFKNVPTSYLFDFGVWFGIVFLAYGVYRLVRPSWGSRRQIDELNERLKAAQANLVEAVRDEDDYGRIEEAADNLKSVAHDWGQIMFFPRSAKKA